MGAIIFGQKKFEIFSEPPLWTPKTLKIFIIFKSKPTCLHISKSIQRTLSQYYWNKNVCEKLELKILIFGWMANIFVRTKKNVSFFSWKFDLYTKYASIQKSFMNMNQVFDVLSALFVLLIQIDIFVLV